MNTTVDVTPELQGVLEHLVEPLGYSDPKLLNDGRIACIMPLMFTAAIITMTPAGMAHGYEDRWCYNSKESALEALSKWDGTGEPDGWHRHPGTGRRRATGDPLQEYINH
jgi:hypothetical protein